MMQEQLRAAQVSSVVVETKADLFFPGSSPVAIMTEQGCPGGVMPPHSVQDDIVQFLRQ
jgi:hypothetical protein